MEELEAHANAILRLAASHPWRDGSICGTIILACSALHYSRPLQWRLGGEAKRNR